MLAAERIIFSLVLAFLIGTSICLAEPAHAMPKTASIIIVPSKFDGFLVQTGSSTKKSKTSLPKLFFADLKETCRPGDDRTPKQNRLHKIEEREYKADDKCGKEKVLEE
jgi:hypothetical protein